MYLNLFYNRGINYFTYDYHFRHQNSGSCGSLNIQIGFINKSAYSNRNKIMFIVKLPKLSFNFISSNAIVTVYTICYYLHFIILNINKYFCTL